MTTDQAQYPLANLKVLDFSRVLAGPFAGRMLSDLGADVVKVEPPDGDVTRFWGKVVGAGDDVDAGGHGIDRNRKGRGRHNHFGDVRRRRFGPESRCRHQGCGTRCGKEQSSA